MRADVRTLIWAPNQRRWLADNFMCSCFDQQVHPGMIYTYVPRGTVNPECGCRNYVPPIPFSELKGTTYDAQRR